jgi:ornithine carbamoyltransferase
MITLNQLTPEALETVIETSLRVKQNPIRYSDVLANKTLYMLFQKTSTCTALGFGLGMAELGGRYFIQPVAPPLPVIGSMVFPL